MLSSRYVSALVRSVGLGACPGLLFLCANLQPIHAQTIPTVSMLSANSGQVPSNLTCTVSGLLKPGTPAPSGTVTFTDLTQNQMLGAAPLAGPATFSLQPYGAPSPSVSGFDNQLVASSVPTGDFNGDGIPDLAFAYQIPTTGVDLMVGVMLGNGDGTFQAPTTIDLGAMPGYVYPNAVVADVNGDGKPDLIIAAASGSGPYTDLWVLLGNGDGTFQAPITNSWTIGEIGIAGVATGDFNDDGKVDVAISASDDPAGRNPLWILLGDGSGHFTQSTSYPSEAAGEIRAADLRNNGKLDLLVLVGGQLQILLGNGDGTFAAAQVLATPAQVFEFEIGDFNEDGLPDVAAIYDNGTNTVGEVQILLGKGDGAFQAGSTYPDPNNSTGYLAGQRLFIGNFHGSGHQDLLVLDDPSHADVYTGAGDGTFQPASHFNLPVQVQAIMPGQFVTQGPSGAESLAYFSENLPATAGTMAPALAQTATLPPYTFTPVAPAMRSLQCSYPGDSNFSAGVSPAVTYTIPTVPTPAIQPNGGTFSAPVTVTLSDSQSGVTSYYTTDGSIPTTSSTPYTAPFQVSQSEVVTVLATAPGYFSSTNSASLSFAPPAPVIYPPGGTFSPPFVVAITEGTPGTVIHYTTDGSTPTASSPVYNGNLALNSSATVSAVAIYPGWNPSPVTSATFTMGPRTPTPVISPPSGSYSGTQTVSITDSDSSATIDYSIDGTTPNTPYTGPFPVSATSTVQAIAGAGGYTNSLSASAIYTINTVGVNLTVTGADPYTMACRVTGLSQFSSSGPTGTVTFTDTSTAQTLGTAALATTPAVPQLQYVDDNLISTDHEFNRSMATADFNGDGKIDVIVGDQGGLYLSLGNGDGTFQPPAPITTATQPAYAIATGDFNGDGKMDIALPETVGLGGFVSVYLGNGDGTLQAPVTYSTGSGAYHIVAADFRGNGNLDLAVTGTNGTQGVVWVLLGNGDGTFQAAVSYPVGITPYELVVGDFTGDGIADVAVLRGDGSVAVLPGNGDGTFGNPIVTTGVNGAAGLAAADFNRDGHLDLAVGTEASTILILLGNGDGTFQYTPSLFVPVSGIPTAVAVADFNSDGIPDLASIALSDVRVNLGKGDGTFGAETNIAIPDGYVGSISVANFNGGSSPEIAAGYGTETNLDGFEVFDYLNLLGATARLSNVSVPAGSIAQHGLQCNYPGDSHYQGGTSNVVSETYTQLPAPVFSLLVGVYNAPQTVSITDGNSSAAIYYTTDGSTPTTSSTKYTGPIPVSTTTTFKAIADDLGYIDSAVSEAAYTFASTPSFSPPPGSYASAQQVTINDATPGATLYYTTDGTAPTVKSSVYLSPVTVAGNTTLQAMAVAPGYLNSAVATGSYAAGSLQATTTTLQASTLNVAPGQQVTLTATITGSNPTGSVTFSANGVKLGTGAVTNGTATLQTSFAAAGNYTVTATYSGDAGNATSASSAISITVVAAGFIFGTPPGPQTISPGAVATYQLSFTAHSGYTGTIDLSCSGLPTAASCSFKPSSLKFTGSGSLNSTLSIATTAPSSAPGLRPAAPGQPLGKPLLFAGLFGLLFGLTRTRRIGARLRSLACLVLLPAAALFSSGCGGGSSGVSPAASATTGTPAGTYTVTVNAVDPATNLKQTLTVTLTVQ